MKRLAISICVLSVVAMLLPSLAEAHGGRRGRVQVNVGRGFGGGFAQVNVGRRGFFGGGRRAVQVNVGHGFRQQAVFFRQPAFYVPQQQVIFGNSYGYGLQQQVIVQQAIGGCYW